MNKFLKGSLIAFGVVFCVVLLGGTFFLYETKALSYVTCYDIVKEAYMSEKIDMDVVANLDSSLPDMSIDFNLVKMPYGNETAIQYTVDSKLGDFKYYQLDNDIFVEDDGNFPFTNTSENIMNFMVACGKFYNSGVEIVEEKFDQNTKSYTINIPQEEVRGLFTAYYDKDFTDYEFSDFTVTVVAQDNELESFEVVGSTSYSVFDKMEASGDFSVYAEVNGINEEVLDFEVPKNVENIPFKFEF